MVKHNKQYYDDVYHLLKKIDSNVSFSFIYDTLSPYYPSIGRPSIDPVSLFVVSSNVEVISFTVVRSP